MENVKLPLEKAQEPIEEAKQPSKLKTKSPLLPTKRSKDKFNVSFAESTECEDKPESQSSASYKEALSQPAPGLTQRQRLQWLQKRRNPGLWVQCDACDRWRHLPFVIDSHELPSKWYCKMNPDSSLASCTASEMPIRLRDEEDLIHSEYSAGSVVWARLPGWPWWPAMVDDCPDNEQFYWLDGFSDIPTHYNVVFFDAFDVTRAWIAPDHMKPYSSNKKGFKRLLNDKRFKSRLEVATKQADDADLLPLADRLNKYSFIARYKGTIDKPKKINKKVLEKFKKQLKRKLNIEFSDNDSSDEDFIEPKETTKKKTNKNNNVKIVTTPKRNNRNNIAPRVLKDSYNRKNRTAENDNDPTSVKDSVENIERNNTLNRIQNDPTDTFHKDSVDNVERNNTLNKIQDVQTDTFHKDSVDNLEQNKTLNMAPDSMTVQIGSSEIAQIPGNTTVSTITDNNQDKTCDTEKTEHYEVRIPSSPTSDDFDF